MSTRRWLATTPGRLRTASIAIVAASVLLAVVATVVTSRRVEAAKEVARQSGPALAAAQSLYGSLADADATASTIFLRAGLEPPVLRRRYVDDIDGAGRQLALVSRSADRSALARQAARTIAEDLPEYTGLVESARANNRQGFPVGGAYLRQASILMRTDILPAATALYRDAALRLLGDDRSGTSRTSFLVVIVAFTVVLTLLLATQLYVLLRTRRWINPGLLGATVVIIGVSIVVIMRLVAAHDALIDAQQRGSDEVEILASARILTLQAQNLENLALVDRGVGDAYTREFDRVMHDLGGTDGSGGLLGDAQALAQRTGDASQIRPLRTEFLDLANVHAAIRIADNQGDYNHAVALAVGSDPASTPAPTVSTSSGSGREATAIAALDRGFRNDIARAEARLESRARDSEHDLRLIGLAVIVLVALAALFAVAGLEPRIAEYR